MAASLTLFLVLRGKLVRLIQTRVKFVFIAWLRLCLVHVKYFQMFGCIPKNALENIF